MTVLIYVLSDPRTNEVRYVGKTILTLKRRLGIHLYDKRKTYKSGWLRSLLALGLSPIIEEIDRVENSNDEDWQETERFWITHLAFLGCRLTNLESGGYGGKRLSEVTKTRISSSLRGREFSDETKRKISESKTGTKLTDAHKKSMSRANLGKTIPDEVRMKMSLSLRGRKRPRTPEHQANLTASLKGKGPTSEHQARVAQMNRGSKRSEETRKKMGAWQIGRKMSEETLARMRIAAAKRWDVRRSKAQPPAITASI